MNHYADIHCHPSLHPFAIMKSGKTDKLDVWERDPPKNRQRDDKYPEYSQSDFSTMALGNVKLVMASLYPLEQGWLDANILGDSFLTDMIANFVTRLPTAYINMVQSEDFNYFETLQEIYTSLKDAGNTEQFINGSKYRFKLLRNRDEIAPVLEDENTIGVILSIEGVQSMISANASQVDSASFDYEQTYRNIETVKNWEFPPLYVTLAHHFYNGFCGHSRSIYSPGSYLLNQSAAMNHPINSRGEEVIDCLLGINDFTGNGRRIIIDTKHMSVASRMMYYDKIRKINLNKADDEKIPIIASHSGYSGHASLQDSIIWPDTFDDKYKKADTFNNWSINLSDDEIVEIFNSNGLIGLNLDERILSSYDIIRQYDSMFRKRDIKRNNPEVRKYWARQILRNVLAIVRAVYSSGEVKKEGRADIWNMISIGSDFDGMINPVDAFVTAEEFPSLEEELNKLLPYQKEFSDLGDGMESDQLIRKLMYENAVDFAKRNFR